MDIFRKIVKDGERAILFSTHITSDLDKCATNITYIHDGEIQYTGTKADFINKYLYVEKQVIQKDLLNKFIAYKDLDSGFEGLILADNKDIFDEAGITTRTPDLEEVMVYLERSKGANEEFTL